LQLLCRNELLCGNRALAILLCGNPT